MTDIWVLTEWEGDDPEIILGVFDTAEAAKLACNEYLSTRRAPEWTLSWECHHEFGYWWADVSPKHGPGLSYCVERYPLNAIPSLSKAVA